MHTYFRKLPASTLTLLLFLFVQSCQKKIDDGGLPPSDGKAVIINTKITSATHTKATIAYEISSDGGNAITENGICYSTSQNPTTSDTKIAAATNGVGTYSISISGLNTSTKYYVRAYAINSIGTAYGSETNFTTKTITPGDKYAGGIVFYLDATGLHGLVSAEQGLGMSAKWGCKGVSITGTGTAIGTGQANTTAIVNACSTPEIAARLCDTLVYNGYSDWFLPSRDELAEMFKYRTQIGFNTNFRWSSSELDSDSAWSHSFDPAATGPTPLNKDEVHGVRPIRAF